MNCNDFLAQARSYFEDELSPAQRQDMEAHAEACASCGDLMRKARELNCREFVEFIGAYLESRLTADERQRFEHHLSICPDCVSYLDTYRTTIHLTKDSFGPDGPVPEDVPADLVAAVLAARRREG
jgi:anti-sigma factor RsiW